MVRGPVSGTPLPPQLRIRSLHFHYAVLKRVFHPNARSFAKLLGPCFKTGDTTPFRQHQRNGRERCSGALRASVRPSLAPQGKPPAVRAPTDRTTQRPSSHPTPARGQGSNPVRLVSSAGSGITSVQPAIRASARAHTKRARRLPSGGRYDPDPARADRQGLHRVHGPTPEGVTPPPSGR